MMTERKITYNQAVALEKGQTAARMAAKRRAAQTVEQTPDEKAKWEEDRKAAVAAYRAKKESKTT